MRATTPEPLTLAVSDGGEPATVMLYRCRLSLAELRETGHPELRFCDHCSRSVFRAHDADGLLQLVAADACIWTEDGGGLREMGLVVRRD